MAWGYVNRKGIEEFDIHNVITKILNKCQYLEEAWGNFSGLPFKFYSIITILKKTKRGKFDP